MKTNYPQILAMRGLVQEHKARSAWERGVKAYAHDLLTDLTENNDAGDNMQDWTRQEFRRRLLNGARDWKQYSYGGCSLYYDGDIARRLCTQTELCRTNNGKMPPNNRENWLDVQTRALYQAADLLEGFFADMLA